jgi:hypothetical protein
VKADVLQHLQPTVDYTLMYFVSQLGYQLGSDSVLASLFTLADKENVYPIKPSHSLSEE